MNSAGQLAIKRLRKQLDAAPWLHWALIGIGILAALLLIEHIEKIRIQWQNDAIEEESTLRRIRALQGQEVWLEREKQVTELHAALTAQIPSAGTAGVAQAAVQAWLNGLGNSTSQPESIRISVEGVSPVETIPSIVRVRATLRGAMTPRETMNILRQIEGGSNLAVIETVDIRSDSSRTASLGISAYYRIAKADAGTQQ